MDAQRNPPTEIAVPLNATAQEVVLLAAQLGAQITDDVFVSYTTLLLGLLLADLDHDPSQLPAWQGEANRTLKVDLILAGKPGLTREAASRHAASVRRGQETSWPTGRPLLSISARNVLQRAADVARQNCGAQASVTPADIMASYLHTIPPAHQEQAENWGLVEPTIKRIGALLPPAPAAQSSNPPPTTPPLPATQPTTANLPGYDQPTSTILAFALALATRRRKDQDPLIASETLLVAIAETAQHLPHDAAAEAAVLHGMLHAADPSSVYSVRRDSLFNLQPITIPSASSADWPPFTRNAQLILEAARDFATRMSQAQLVAPRHLIAALVSEPDGTDRPTISARWLDQSGITTDVLRAALARIIHDSYSADDQAAWRDLLLGHERSVVTTARPDTFPDDPRAVDTLDLRRYADAIGGLISATNQKPPLSIAVFGPWGSGKSFFMAMIRAAVNDFAQAGANAVTTGKPTPFLRRVVQIQFNAWHYAEGNLWASLVHALLVGLQQALSPKDDTSVFQTVLNRLALHQTVMREAEAKLREAEQQLKESQAALQKTEEESVRRRTQENAIEARDAIKAVQQEALEVLRPSGEAADAPAWIKSVGDSVAKAATYLGRPELTSQLNTLLQATKEGTDTSAALQVKIAEVQDLLDEAKASTERGYSLLSWLANAKIVPGERIKLLAALAFTLVLLFAISVFLERYGNSIAATFSAVAAFIVPLITALAAVISWARRHLVDANRAFAVLGSIRDRIEARQAQRLAARDAELLAARRATAEAEAETTRRRAQVEAATVAVANAQNDLNAATSPERLNRFVAQRLAEGDYQRHLGLIHTIRGDLDQLEQILKDVHPLEAELAAAEPPVQRIVLYIDDLDRCPPDRVVEVLEAVHLLLAVQLFVVVVGVDIRWVAQALRRRYPLQLGNRPGVASPTDYLEKVFQIPFWLPAMDPKAGRRLLEAAIGPAVPSTAESARTLKAPEMASNVTTADHSPSPPVPAEPDASAPPSPPDAPASTFPKTAAPADTRAAAEALRLDEVERTRLLDMAAAVGASPRRANRFANLYRLLKASLSPAERRGFVLDGGKAGSYGGALILLAAATGAPHATRALIAHFAEDPGQDLQAYLPNRFALVADVVPPAEKAAFEAVQTLVLAAPDASDISAHVRHLRLWAPRVSRFVFEN